MNITHKLIEGWILFFYQQNNIEDKLFTINNLNKLL